MSHRPNRRKVGEILPAFELETLAHGRITVPGSELIHLQFRRFAGCPVCNVQIRRFAEAHAELNASGVRTVSLFYSPRAAMLDYQHELPHPIVPDPDRHLFNAFFVERTPWAALHPRVWATAIGGLVSGPSNPFEGGAGDGLPADFLIQRAGSPTLTPGCQIVALHYGTHIDDQWSVEDVIGLARTHSAPAATSLPSPSTHTSKGQLDHEAARS